MVGIVIIIIYLFSLELVIFFNLTEPLCLMDGYLKVLDSLEIEQAKAKRALDCLEKIYDYKYPDNISLTRELEENRLGAVEAIEVAESNLRSINREITSHIKNYRGVS